MSTKLIAMHQTKTTKIFSVCRDKVETHFLHEERRSNWNRDNGYPFYSLILYTFIMIVLFHSKFLFVTTLYKFYKLKRLERLSKSCRNSTSKKVKRSNQFKQISIPQRDQSGWIIHFCHKIMCL